MSTVAALPPAASVVPPDPPAHRYTNPRKELERALLNLQKDAAPYVNLSRIQLALRNLRQEPGEESIRIAILALPGHDHRTSAIRTAKRFLRALIADPLSSPASWEKEIENYDVSKPLVVRIGKKASISVAKRHDNVELLRQKSQSPLLQEIHADSYEFNDHGIEVLLMENNAGLQDLSAKQFEEQILVPSIEIQSGDTRYSPIMTPVHKTLLVAEGFQGALSLAGLPPHGENVFGSVNIPGYKPDDHIKNSTPFAIVDLPAAEKGIEVFRGAVSRAMEYERLWFDSNFPAVIKWLKNGTLRKSDASTKPIVISLVASLIRQAEAAVEVEAARHVRSRIKTQHSPTYMHLDEALTKWSEAAHGELQNSLDAAFQSRHWKRLGWWRLFWRVDDVSMVAGELLTEHFLSNAERNAVYLAGRIKEAGVFNESSVGLPIEEGYVAPRPFTGQEEPKFNETGTPVAKNHQTLAETEEKSQSEQKHYTISDVTTSDKPKYTTYPTNIAHTRTYLTQRSVPALQALAQRLILQTTSTMGTMGALGILMFLSDFSLEAAGAVTALGVVWSLRRMQARWENARAFWVGEVREEGRKAVRAVEASVMDVLRRESRSCLSSESEYEKSDLECARESVARAKEILRQLR